MHSVLAKCRHWEGSFKSIRRHITSIHACDNSDELADVISSVRSKIVGIRNRGIYSFIDIDETLLK